MKRGILYLATGEDFVEEAIQSANSAKKVMPEVSIALITDQDVETEVFDTTLDLDNPRHDGGDRVLHMLRSPYDRTLFVDTDIYFTSPVHELFELLDEFDLGVATNGQFFKAIEHHGDEIPESFPEFNGGVILYADREPVHEFQRRWEVEFLADADVGLSYNQPSLRKVLYESEIRYTILPRRYNCIFRRPGQVHGTVKLFHGRLQSVDTYGAEKALNIDTVVEDINASDDNRVYYQAGSGIELRPGALDRIRNSLFYNGVLGTVSESIKKIFSR